MATRRCVDDCRDRQQWHALVALVPRCRRHRAGSGHHCVSGHFRLVHGVDPNQVQVEASGGYVVYHTSDLVISYSCYILLA